MLDDGELLDDMLIDCPKCLSKQASYTVEDDELLIRCLCGYRQWVYSEKNGIVRQRSQKFDPLQLPREGSQISIIFQCVVDNWPDAMNTTQILQQLGKEDNTKNFKATSNGLGILAHKKLVERVQNGNGKKGGSTWRVSEEARRYLKLKEVRTA